MTIDEQIAYQESLLRAWNDCRAAYANAQAQDMCRFAIDVYNVHEHITRYNAWQAYVELCLFKMGKASKRLVNLYAKKFSEGVSTVRVESPP